MSCFIEGTDCESNCKTPSDSQPRMKTLSAEICQNSETVWEHRCMLISFRSNLNFWIKRTNKKKKKRPVQIAGLAAVHQLWELRLEVQSQSQYER